VLEIDEPQQPEWDPVWWERWLTTVKPPLSTVVGGAMGKAGTDRTEALSRRSCVIFAPHPDDETLGCAVTIMRKVDAGTPVRVVVVTDGSTYPPHKPPEQNIADRDAELRAACRVLGLEDDAVLHLSFPETKLHLAGEALVDALSDIVSADHPEDVLVTSEADPHSDHAALGQAARRAMAGRDGRLCVYPIWQWERPRSWMRTLQGASRPERVRTSGYLDRKREAIGLFRSQLTAAAGGELDKGLGLTPRFLRRFTGAHEVFFPIPA